MVFYGVILGASISLFTRASKKAIALNKLDMKMQRVRQFIRYHKIPDHLSNALRVGKG
jgi:hypothetical protein